MSKKPTVRLARREQQIMDALHVLGRATAHEVRERLPDPPSYSATRALLAVLERKGHIKHAQEGPRYVYFPSVSKEQAGRRAVAHLLDVFFGGSAERAVAALLDAGAKNLSNAELDRLQAQIAAAKKEGR
jgi:predicted transcriptional regulator